MGQILGHEKPKLPPAAGAVPRTPGCRTKLPKRFLRFTYKCSMVYNIYGPFPKEKRAQLRHSVLERPWGRFCPPVWCCCYLFHRNKWEYGFRCSVSETHRTQFSVLLWWKWLLLVQNNFIGRQQHLLRSIRLNESFNLQASSSEDLCGARTQDHHQIRSIRQTQLSVGNFPTKRTYR